MILLLFILAVATIIYSAYFYVFYRKHSIANDVAVVAGRNGSLFRTGSSIFAKNLIFELAEKKCNLILIDTAENETSLKDLKNEVEEETGVSCKYYIADIGSEQKGGNSLMKVVQDLKRLEMKYHQNKSKNTSSNNSFSNNNKNNDDDDDDDNSENENSTALEDSKCCKVDIVFTIPCFTNISSRTPNSDVKNHTNMIQSFLPGILERKKGHIVTLSGASGLLGLSTVSPMNVNNSSSSLLPDENKQNSSSTNPAVGIFNNFTAKTIEDCSTNFGLVGLAESLFLTLRRHSASVLSSSSSSSHNQNGIKSTLVCATDLDVIRNHDDYVDEEVLLKIDTSMKLLAERIVEGVQREEEKIYVPFFGLWFGQILKLLPMTWMDSVLDKWSMFKVFGERHLDFSKISNSSNHAVDKKTE